MTNYDLEESKLIITQIILSLILLFTTIISISLSYNFLMTLEKKEPIYSASKSYDILIFNRFLMFMISLIFVYINVRDKNVKKKYDLEDEFADLQILASALTLMASLIVLYIGFKSGVNVTSEENPTI